LSHIIHAVRDWNHAKGVDHVVTGEVAQPIEVVKVTIVSKTGGLLCLLVLLDVSLRMRQVTSSRGVATADRALLEVTLEDVTAREGIAAEDTHVWAITGVSQKMALEMLGMEVSLGAVRAREFAISVLHGNHGVLGASTGGRGSRSSRSTWKDTASSLGANNVSRRLTLGHDGLRLHKRSRAIGRRNTRLGHDATRRHRSQHRRTATTGRGWRDRLRMRGSSGRLGHHGSRGAIALGRRVLVRRH
jgi:hypothetical protein